MGQSEMLTPINPIQIATLSKKESGKKQLIVKTEKKIGKETSLDKFGTVFIFNFL